jgi:hypothetical protein
MLMLVLAAAPAAQAVRPTGLLQTAAGPRFLVHYTTTPGPDATTDAAAQGVLSAAEHAYDVYRSWGWPDPPSDAPTFDADPRIDIYVHQIVADSDPQGVTRSDAGQTGLGISSYFEVQPAATAKPVVTSHELFHVFQRGVYRTASVFLRESTAVWASTTVTGDAEWGHAYLTDPSLSLECPGQPLAAHCEYVHWPFFAVAAARHGNDLLATAWLRLRVLNPGADPGQSLRAVDDTLHGRGSSLSAAFAESASDNLAAAFGRRQLLPPTAISPSQPPSRAGAQTFAVSHLAARVVVVAGGSGRNLCAPTILRVRVTLPPGIGAQPVLMRPGAVVPLAVSGNTATGEVPLDSSCSRAALLLANPSLTADNQAFVVNAATTLPTPKLKLKRVPRRVGLPSRGRPTVRFRITANGAGRAVLTLRCGKRRATRGIRVASGTAKTYVRSPVRRLKTCSLQVVPFDVLGERSGTTRKAKVKLVNS